jgi:DNA-binding SARP family transcriptional activator
VLAARLFGGLAVEVDGRPTPPIPGLKPRSLLAYLLLHPGPHPRSRLAGTFWPDVLDTSARASLRSALWTIRGSLDAVGGAAWLRGDRASAGLDPDLPRSVDAEEFDRLAAAGDEASLERAVTLARGPLLADLAEEWALEAQDRYRERLIEVLQALAGLAEARGDGRSAVAWTRRALEHDRLREATHRELMRRLEASGERAAALAAYRRLRALLAAELGIPPSAETRALAERLREGGAPPAPEPPPRPAPAPRRAPALVGRRAELEALGGAWERAREGRGGVVLVEGEAGIGKTRLVAELSARAAAAGARAATGAALELDGGPPFAAWSEALRGLVPAVPPPPEAADWPGELARLCPAVVRAWGRRAAQGDAQPDLERARLFEAVAEALAWAAAGAPLLLVLEDAHAADAASVALLAYVGRRLPDLPALLVLTRREAAPAPDLDLALEGLRRRDALIERLRLGPLDDEELRAVVREAAPDLAPDAALAAVRAAEGNPLLAREAALAASAGRDPAEGLRSAVRVPLGRLPDDARRLVELTAAAARPLEPGEAADLVGPEVLPDALAAAWEAELLDRQDPRRVRFTHALLREACYAELPPARRRWAHARLAEGLGRGPGRAAEVARHLRLAGDDGAARRFLAAAAGEARGLGALEEAAGYLREATGIAGGGAEEAELWLELADVEAWRGLRAGMDEAFERARERLEARGDRRALAAAWEARGRWLRTTQCYPRESLAAYGRALELLDGAEAPELRALALTGSAWCEAMVGDASRVEALIAEVEGVAEAGDDRGIAAQLEAARAAAWIRAGRFDEIDGPTERALDHATAAGRPDLACTTLVNAASAVACAGDFARALALADRARAPGGRAGPDLEAFVHAARAYALSRLGRHEEAVAAAREEVALASRAALPELEATAAYDLGVVLLAAGDPGAAAERIGVALAGPTRAAPRSLARLQRAEALVAAGDLGGAEEELGGVPYEPVGPADLPDTLVARMARVQGLLAAARGDGETALRRLGEAEAGWRRRMAGIPAGDVYAANLADLGRPPVAGLIEPALELARTLVDRAELLAALGRGPEAAPAAAEAAGLAEAAGHGALHERAAALAALAPAGGFAAG